MSPHSRVRFFPSQLALVFRAVVWPLLAALALSGCQNTQPLPSPQTDPSHQAVRKVSKPPARVAEKRVFPKVEQPGDAETAARLGLTVGQVQRLHTQRALDNQALAVIPPDKLQRALWRIENPKPDHPGEAAAFRRLQQLDETGQIEDGALVRALEQRKLMPVDPAAWEFTQSVVPAAGNNNLTAGIQPGAWTSLGPGNIGGRTRCMVIHPTTPATMWAGSVGGGVWKTTNSGATWAPLNDFMASLAVSSLVIDPTNPDVLYAGTGEGFYNSDGLRGAGIFKTTNGGTTWTQLGATANSNFYYVNRITISPVNNQIMLAATRNGIWRTTDGGTNWVQTLTSDAQDVDFHPTDGTKAVAAGYTGMIRYSNDGGATWLTPTGIPTTADFLSRIEVAYAPSNGSIVYASYYNSSGQVYRSANGGATYTLQNTGTNYLGGQGWYDNLLWVDPTNPAIVIVGGIDLYRSTNSGASLTKISQWFSAPASAHADHHFAVGHPGFNGTTNKTVFFANDGGVYRASDVYTVALTTGWQELNNNYGVTQFYGGAGNAASGRFIGGTQDNGTLRYTTAGGSEGWTTMFGGDGGWCASDPTDPNYFYGEYVRLAIHRSTNGGTSSNYIFSGITDAESAANFIAPFILDPNIANTMLAGGASLWRSTNVKAGTPSWAAIKASIGSNISAICVAPGNSNVIWVGHNNGNVYYTTNGTAVTPTWTQADLGTPNLPNRYCHRIVIDPLITSRVYVCFGGFSADNLYRTTNNGVTWTDVSGALPSAPIRSLQVAPFNSNYLYAGTEVGVFASANGGTTWSPTNEGPANVSVDELFWVGNKLTAATHGRGFYSIVVSATPSISAAGSVITSESCPLGNGAPDPHETVTVNFSLRNDGAAATNLVATLQATGGVTVPSAAQTYGAMGTDTAVTRPFTFIAEGACGSTLTATLQLQDGVTNLGTITFTFQLGVDTTVLGESFDAVTVPALPTGWTTTSSGAQSPWATSTAAADSAPNAAFCPNPGAVGETSLVTPVLTVPATARQLTFRNRYELEDTYDGGVLEIKIGAGAFTDIVTAGGTFVEGGYDGVIDAGYENPLAGRNAWTGSSGGFVLSRVNLPPAAAGESVQFRWRCGTDNSVAATGWYVDSITMTGVSCCEGATDLSVTMTDAPDPVVAGQNLTWTVNVTNNSSDNATNVVLTNMLPPGVAYVSASATQGTASHAAGTVTASLGTLSYGTSATVTIVGTPGPAAGNMITNSATAGANEADVNLLDNTATTTTTVHHPPVVSGITVSMNEDMVRTFAPANFTGSFSDLNGDALAMVRITSLPANGVLKLGGYDITTVPTDIALASTGTLQFVPAANFNGAISFGWNGFDGVLFAVSDAMVNITVNAVNDNPVADPDMIARYPSQSVKVLVATLLANDTDIDNQVLTLTAVASATPEGATVTRDATWVYYTPAPGSTSPGGFAYTISDGNGGTASGAVTVNVISSTAQGSNLTKIETLGDGSKRIHFAGIPGRIYRVQSTDSLVPPAWLDRTTVTADLLGRFQFTDSLPLPPTRFYRSVSP